ncbi:MAG: tripartite tricarboxylate transporter substrate binding protein [Pseudomonadota bacterium]
MKTTMMFALIAAAISLANPSSAQTYPDKPIKLIVAVAAGGPMDTIARVVADQLQAKLGQPVIVENRPGAGSTLGAKAVISAPPDGATLIWGTLSMIAIAPALYKDPGYDPKALVPVALIADFPHVMVISPTVPANTMAEFIAYAKANRGKMNFGGSLGTPPQLLGAMFSKVADLGMTYVPYKGGAPSIPDLLAGRLQMQFDALTLLQPLIKEGKLRALAVVSNTRWPDLPDVPTLAETGFKDFPGNPWAGIMAPPGTPAAVVAKLNAVTNEILRSPDTKASLARLNVLLRPSSTEEFAAFVAQQTPVWTEMVRTSGATAE